MDLRGYHRKRRLGDVMDKAVRGKGGEVPKLMLYLVAGSCKRGTVPSLSE